MAKFVRNITLRGTIEGTTTGNYIPHRVMLDDGNPNTAFRIVSVVAWPVDGSNFNNDGNFIISTEESGLTSYTAGFTDASDNRQIGWGAFATGGAFGDTQILNAVVDPDNIVTEDLWLAGSISSAGEEGINYLIIAERLTINLNENLYATVRAKSQSN